VATVNKALDKATAETQSPRLVGLLGEIASLSKEQGQLVIGASRCFIRSLDMLPDFNSRVGFEAGVRVLNFVVGQIGRQGLKLEGRSI
jgi:hypothetical protein